MRREILQLQGVAFSGPTPAPYAVIGEAPGKVEIEEGRPFVGPAGQLLRRLMRESGLDPDRAFWTNTVPYLPGTKTPTSAEVLAMRPLLDRQLLLADPRVVILAGGVALSAFRPGLAISYARGAAIWRSGVIYVPIYHPAAALRDPGKISYVRDDLALVAAIMTLVDKFGQVWPEACVHCGGELAAYDSNGMGYCRTHWDEGKQLKLVVKRD